MSSDSIPDDIAKFMEDAKEAPVKAQPKTKEKAGTDVVLPLDGTDLYDMDEENEALHNATDTVPAPERVDLPHDDTFDTAADMSAGESVGDSNDFTKRVNDVDITVDDADKEAYMRSALAGTPTIFSVDIGAVTIDVSMASTKEATAVLDAMHILTNANDSINYEEKWLMYFQCLTTHIQLRRVNNAPASTYDPEIKRTARELAAYLADADLIAEINDMPVPRWQLVTRAQQVAARKMQICNENLLSRNFFESAGSA